MTESSSAHDTMRAILAPEFGGPELAELRTVPPPSPPGAGEVLVAVQAVGIALPDLLLLSGIYPGMDHALPHPIGIEYAGSISATGAGVTAVAAGDRVCGMVYPPQGAAREQLVVPEHDVAPLPASFSFVEGAAIPSAYSTAEVVLHRQGGLRSGERVLVLSGASGLGLAAIGLARAAGAEVYGAASPAKHDAMLAAGAHEAVDPTVEDWSRALPQMDLIIDPIGGESYTTSYKLLARGGRLACVDATSRHPKPGERYRREPDDLLIDPLKLIVHAKSILGIDMPTHWVRDGGQAPLMRDALARMAAGEVRPTIAEVFPLEETQRALRLVESRTTTGRVVVTVNPS